MRYWNYLLYVLKHKYHVFLACLKLDVPFLSAIFHDWDKLSPNMFLSYANYFYNVDGSSKQKRNKEGYFKPADTGDVNFERCVLSHIRRNKHHWEYWTTPKFTYEMPIECVKEMVADWIGAGKVQKSDGVIFWYRKNRDNLVLHEKTRIEVEKLILQHG